MSTSLRLMLLGCALHAAAVAERAGGADATIYVASRTGAVSALNANGAVSGDHHYSRVRAGIRCQRNIIMRAVLEQGVVARWFQDALASIFPLVGLIVAFVGFFKPDQR